MPDLPASGPSTISWASSTVVDNGDGQCSTATQYARDNQHHFTDWEIGPSGREVQSSRVGVSGSWWSGLSLVGGGK